MRGGFFRDLDCLGRPVMGLVRPTEEGMRGPPGQALGLSDKIPGPLNLPEVGARFRQEEPSEHGLRGEIRSGSRIRDKGIGDVKSLLPALEAKPRGGTEKGMWRRRGATCCSGSWLTRRLQ